jgi:hypothetical protein
MVKCYQQANAVQLLLITSDTLPVCSLQADLQQQLANLQAQSSSTIQQLGSQVCQAAALLVLHDYCTDHCTGPRMSVCLPSQQGVQQLFLPELVAWCLWCAGALQVDSLQAMVRDQKIALASTSYALQTAEVKHIAGRPQQLYHIRYIATHLQPSFVAC